MLRVDSSCLFHKERRLVQVGRRRRRRRRKRIPRGTEERRPTHARPRMIQLQYCRALTPRPFLLSLLSRDLRRFAFVANGDEDEEAENGLAERERRRYSACASRCKKREDKDRHLFWIDSRAVGELNNDGHHVLFLRAVTKPGSTRFASYDGERKRICADDASHFCFAQDTMEEESTTQRTPRWTGKVQSEVPEHTFCFDFSADRFFFLLRCWTTGILWSRRTATIVIFRPFVFFVEPLFIRYISRFCVPVL
jgi:hypothetical protein